nr:hypothetical protein [Tanacetum cinerariifolium]
CDTRIVLQKGIAVQKRPPEEATWEWLLELLKAYLSYHLEDKMISGGEKNVTPMRSKRVRSKPTWQKDYAMSPHTLKVVLLSGKVHIIWYQEPALPFEVPTLRVVAYEVVAWTQRELSTVTNITVTNELGVLAYKVVAWTQREVPTVTNIVVTNEDVGSSKGNVLL